MSYGIQKSLQRFFLSSLPGTHLVSLSWPHKTIMTSTLKLKPWNNLREFSMASISGLQNSSFCSDWNFHLVSASFYPQDFLKQFLKCHCAGDISSQLLFVYRIAWWFCFWKVFTAYRFLDWQGFFFLFFSHLKEPFCCLLVCINHGKDLRLFLSLIFVTVFLPTN